MAYISTTARKYRKLTRETIRQKMNSYFFHKKDKWSFSNPITNENVELDALGVEGMLYTLVPFAREAEYKYGQGVARLLLEQSEIENNFTNANRLNEIVKIIISAHIDEWDSNFNNYSLRDLIKFFYTESQNLNNLERNELDKIKFIRNEEYDIVHIKDFTECKNYAKYATWCILSNETLWNTYTNDGINNVFFVLKNNYKNINKPDSNFNKKDEYGLSMISVIVSPNNALAFCTGRYNHMHGGNDSLLSIKELSELIGENFYNVFKPKVGEELKNAIFKKWEETEGDTVSKNKGWIKVMKIDGDNQFPPSIIYSYYDPKLFYLVFDRVYDVDEYGYRMVEVNKKYNIINENGELLL